MCKIHLQKGGFEFMKAFLLALKGFAESIGGLIAVIVILFWYFDILGFLENFPPEFNFLTIGSYLSLFVLVFAIIWAQMKSKILLSHGILFYLFASALSVFLTNLFSNSPTDAFEGTGLIDLVIMAYTLAVVAAYILYSRPKTHKLNALMTIPFLIFFGLYYVVTGFNNSLMALLVVIVALLLGSKVVALAYPIHILLGIVFSALHFIFEAFNNNGAQDFNMWVVMIASIVSLVFLSLELKKAVESNAS